MGRSSGRGGSRGGMILLVRGCGGGGCGVCIFERLGG